jgi:hypothetical protein
MLDMANASFRIRKTPTELEVEFTGESEVALRTFEEKYEQIMKMTHGAPHDLKQPESKDTSNGKRTFKKTGEQSAIRKHLPILKSENFFEQLKPLGEIRTEMRTKGWFHDANDIEYALLHTPELGIKRIKDGKNYKYVNSE